MQDIAQQAMETFHRNSDTMIAGFLVRNPDVDPADIELVFQTVGGTMRFSIEPKELHVPAYLPEGVPGTSDLGATYRDGWNDCREMMIMKAKAARAPDGTIITLAQSLGDVDG